MIDGFDKRSTKPGQLTQGISLLHDYDAAARSRARQAERAGKAFCDEDDELNERRRRKYKANSRYGRAEDALALPDPLAQPAR